MISINLKFVRNYKSSSTPYLSFYFLFFREFQFMTSAFDDALYYQTKTLIQLVFGIGED